MQGISSIQGVAASPQVATAAPASGAGMADSTSGQGSTSAVGAAGSGVAGAAAASGAETTNTTMTMTLVTDRVDSFLSNFGGVVAGNDLIRMVIAMLILDALAGDKKEETNRSSPLAGLLALSLGQTLTSSTLSHYSSSTSTDAVQGAADPRAGVAAGAYQQPAPATSTISMMG